MDRAWRMRDGRKPAWLLAVAFGVAALVGSGFAARAESSSPASDQHSANRPGTYLVSRTAGVLPEGIGLGRHGTFYVTSSGTGAVYRGDLRHHAMRLFAAGGPGSRHSALGVHVDRTGRVFVARPRALDVYSLTGGLLAHRRAPRVLPNPPSLNDLVITRDAVYVTDFANPVVLRAPITRGRIGALRPWLDVSQVEPDLPAQFWFLNGIVASHDARTLLVSSQGLERLLRIQVADRAASVVDLGPTSFAADGLDLSGTELYAVLNYDPPTGPGVYVAELAPDLASGRIVAARTGRLSPFDSPTTLVRAGNRVLVVNSQLDHLPGVPPYTVSAVPLPARPSGSALRSSSPAGVDGRVGLRARQLVK